MRKKALVRMICYALVSINEDIVGNQELEDVESIEDIEEFEVLEERG